MSASSCWRKVKTLEDTGVIRGYTVALDEGAMGFEFHAIVHVQLVRHASGSVAEFMSALSGRDEIRAAHATTGQADYHLYVACRDLADYNAFLEDFLFRIPAVASAQSNVVLKTVKV